MFRSVSLRVAIILTVCCLLFAVDSLQARGRRGGHSCCQPCCDCCAVCKPWTQDPFQPGDCFYYPDKCCCTGYRCYYVSCDNIYKLGCYYGPVCQDDTLRKAMDIGPNCVVRIATATDHCPPGTGYMCFCEVNGSFQPQGCCGADGPCPLNKGSNGK